MMKLFLRDLLERRTVLVRLKSFGLKWVLGKTPSNSLKGMEWSQRLLMALLNRWTVRIGANTRFLQYLYWRQDAKNGEFNPVSYFSIHAMFLQYFKQISIIASRSKGPMTAQGNQFVPSSVLSRLHGDMRESHSKERFAPIFHRLEFLNVPGTPKRYWNIPRNGALSQKSMKEKPERPLISSVRGTIRDHQGLSGSGRGQKWMRAVDGFFQHRKRPRQGEEAGSSHVVSQGASKSLMKAIFSNHQNYWKFPYLLELIVRYKSKIHNKPIKPTLYAADSLGNHLITFRKKNEQDPQQEEMINGPHSNLQVKRPIGDEERRKIIVGTFGSPSLVMKSERATTHGILKNVKRGAKKKSWEGGATQEANVYPSLLERRIFPGEKFLTLQASNANWLPFKRTSLETQCTQIPYGPLSTMPLNTVFAQAKSVRRHLVAMKEGGLSGLVRGLNNREPSFDALWSPSKLSQRKMVTTIPAGNSDNRLAVARSSGGEEIHVTGKPDSKRMLRFLKEKYAFSETLTQPKFQNRKSPKRTPEGLKEQSFEKRHDLAYVPIRNQNFQARVGSDVKMVSPEEGRFDRLEMGKAFIPLNRETNESTSAARGNTPLSRTAVQQIAEKVYHLLLDRVKRERELWRRQA